MTEEHVRAIFLLAGIQVFQVVMITNQYWPDTETYRETRNESPWWLVSTKWGTVMIGWRKRVISIRWGDTNVKRGVDTPDTTDKGTDYIHAWSYAKAVEYLKLWRPE